MPDTTQRKKVLVLLIGEVLEDPRVYKTCMSLYNHGAQVTVACTNPSKRSLNETHRDINIIRFPHPKEFILKQAYNFLQGKLHRKAGNTLAQLREDVRSSSFRTAVRNYLLNLNADHYIKSNLHVNRMLAGKFSESSFDLVHCNDVNTLSAGSDLRKSGAAKEMLYDSHEYWAGMGVEGSRANEMNRKAEAVGIKNADYVVTVNPLIAELLKEEYRLSRLPSVVMNCPYRYDGDVFTGTVHSPVRIIFQGKMQAYRGLEKLILAFKHIDRGVLTMSGYGPLTERFESLVRFEKLTEKVTFTGRYDSADSTAILSGHDIGVITYEGMIRNNRLSSPNKLFEYAMAGLAVASSDLPFLAEMITDNNMGMLIKEITPECIAYTLNAMIADTEQLKTFRTNARAAGIAKFEWEEQFRANYPWNPKE